MRNNSNPAHPRRDETGTRKALALQKRQSHRSGSSITPIRVLWLSFLAQFMATGSCKLLQRRRSQTHLAKSRSTSTWRRSSWCLALACLHPAYVHTLVHFHRRPRMHIHNFACICIWVPSRMHVRIKQELESQLILH